MLTGNGTSCTGMLILLVSFVDKLSLDINECSSNNGGCAHTCTNTAGSYYCTCNTGYSLNNNKHGCTGKV